MNDTTIAGRWRSAAPQLQGLLRIVAAFLFMQFGMMKLFGYPVPMPPGVHVTFPSQMFIAAVLEVFGGAMLLVGWCVRPIAFIVAGEMAVAYFQAHAPHGFWPLANRGTDPVFFCFTWLYFSAAGAGAFSLDTRRQG